MKSEKGAVLRLLFVLFIVLFLVTGLAKALLFPTDISQYELRYNNKVPPLTVSGYMDGSFQTGMDDALADQVSFSTYYKMLYNELVSRLDRVFQPVRNSISGRYVTYKDMYLFNGQLVYKPVSLEERQSAVDDSVRTINPLIEKLPQTQFYLYYVTVDTDLDFVTGENTGIYDYILRNVAVPEKNCACLPIAGFEDYRDNFFFSDHHWTNKGSYRAYLQLLELTEAQGEALIPQGERTLPGIFYGSKCLHIGSTSYYDKISVYDFDLPPMDYSLAGSPLAAYGNTNVDSEVISYAAVNGDDLGCLVISTGKSERENILVIGESYDNAVIRLLASHFNNTHSVDLRYYPHLTGETFNLCDYVQKNDISKVLFIGANEFYSQQLWMME